MIHELLQFTQDLEPGRVLEVHACDGPICECGRHAYDANMGMRVLGKTTLEDFVANWWSSDPAFDWLRGVASDPMCVTFPWLGIVHETGILLVQLDRRTSEREAAA